MSYQYQLRGVKTQMECKGMVADDHLLKDLDYSYGRFPGVSELFLDEELGFGIHPID